MLLGTVDLVRSMNGAKPHVLYPQNMVVQEIGRCLGQGYDALISYLGDRLGWLVPLNLVVRAPCTPGPETKTAPPIHSRSLTDFDHTRMVPRDDAAPDDVTSAKGMPDD